MFDSEDQRMKPKYEKSVLKRHRAIKNVLAFASLSDFTSESLRNYDERMWGVWINPVKQCIHHLKHTLLGVKVWERLHANMVHVSADYVGRFETIADKVDNNYWGEQYTNSKHAVSRDNGQRKMSRKEIRRFVRVLIGYNKFVAAQQKQSANSLIMRDSMFTWMIKKVRKLVSGITVRKQAQIDPNGASNSKESSRQLNKNVKKYAFASNRANDVVTLENPVAFEVRYREGLSMEIDDLLSDADMALEAGSKSM
jgi:hypothetical protein